MQSFSEDGILMMMKGRGRVVPVISPTKEKGTKRADCAEQQQESSSKQAAEESFTNIYQRQQELLMLWLPVWFGHRPIRLHWLE
jgi:hypothetical protein